ncbi:hypothetical protein MMPV_007485 [Pyropia vietnamensis]
MDEVGSPSGSGLRLRRRPVVIAPDGYSSSSSSDDGGGTSSGRMVAAVGARVGVPADTSLASTPVHAAAGSSPAGASDSDAMAVSPLSDRMDVDVPSPVGAPPPPGGGVDAGGAPGAAVLYDLPVSSGVPPPDAAGPSSGVAPRRPVDVGGPQMAAVATTALPAPPAVATVAENVDVAGTPPARRRASDHAAALGRSPTRRRQRRVPPPETVSPLSVVIVLLLLLIPPLVGALSVVAPRVVRSFFLSRPSVMLVLVALVSGALFHTLLRSLGPGGRGDRRRRRRHGDRDGGSPAEAYARLSRRLSVSGREFTEADYELLLELDERDERLERFLHGAGEAVIEALPVYVVKDGGGGRVCAVCMADLAVGDSVRILPCMDQYHVNCIDVWLRQKAVCPVCKWHIG